jgi:hypothetical protein
MTVLVLAALLATVGSLVAGISSMATDGEVGHLRSEQWMLRRVEFQALALLLIAIALLT